MVEHRSVRPAPLRGPSPVRGPVRLLRGWAAAVVATLLAAGSHTLAGNTTGNVPGHDAGPAPVVWILTLALAGPLCTALAGRSLSWWRLWSAVGSSQLLFHGLYSQSAAHPGPTASAGLARGAGPAYGGHGVHGIHGVYGTHATHAAQAAPGAAHGSPHGPDPTLHPESVLGPGTLPGAEGLPAADHTSLAMVAAHVLAAVATVLLLRRGEAMAARVVELAVGWVLRSPGARLARWVPALRLPRLPSRPAAPAWRTGAVVLSGLRLRGPPVPVLSP